MNISVSSRTVLYFLLGINALFFILHMALLFSDAPVPLTTAPIRDRFNMDAEVSVPTWFAQILLFLAAFLAICIGAIKKAQKENGTFPWFFIGIILTYLSIDEGSALHELIAEPVRQALGITSGPLIFAWTIPAALISLAVGLLLFRFYLRLPRETQVLLATAAVLFVGGSIGMEIISGTYWTSQNFTFDKYYSALTGIEETFENTGTALAIFAFMNYLGAMPKKSLPRVEFSK